MHTTFPGALLFAAISDDSVVASSTARTVFHWALGALVVVFAVYIVIEQVGSWRRRRSGRE